MSRRPSFPRHSAAASLLGRIERRSARLGVIGLGYVGLPLAVEFGKAGFHVIGVDVDRGRVTRLRQGRSYVQDVPAADVRELVRAGRLEATWDFDALRRADTVNICVPTPLSKQRDPDVSYIVAATREVARTLHRGQLIVLESTTYPGTTEELVLPLLEERGMKVGRDFFLAFSPERVDPGNPQYTTRNIPKVVGGVTPVCTELACRLYQQRLERVIPVSSTRVAEMVKLLENTFRSVNIGLVNEMALMSSRLGIDVWEVIEAAATKPFGFMPFFPGPGLGGHCQDGDEFLFVRRAGGFEPVRMKDIARGRKARRVGNVDVIPLHDVEVLSFDLDHGRSCYRPATHLFRRWHPRRIRLRTREGRSLTTSDGHPMIVRSQEGFGVCRTDGLDGTSELVLAVDLPEDTCPEHIDLLEELAPGTRGIRVVPRSGGWDEHWDTIRSEARASGVERRDVRKTRSLPLDAWLRLEGAGRSPYRRNELLLATGRGASHTTLPVVLPVNEDFARLIGYYVTEGCLTHDRSWRTRWTFGAHETELIADLTGILDRFGLRWSMHRMRRWKAVQIKVSSNLLGRLIADHLRCGRRSEEMRLPSFLLGASVELRRALLGALLNGDGSVDVMSGTRRYRKNGRAYRHRCNSACVSYFTSSPVLLQQVTMLMHSLGIVPSVRRERPELRIYGEPAMRAVAPLFLGRKAERLVRHLANRSRPMPVKRVRRHDHHAIAGLEKNEALGGDYVYSIEVPGTQTYVTSYGLVSHNCIPIDPFYLSWKARASGFEARMIELAGHINAHMPDYVCDLVAESLNRAGKAVRGARVLVLGVAYKANIDDTRESPSLDIMTTLERRGAKVEYSDPHVPRLRFGNRRLTSVPLTPPRLRQFDCVVIATAHRDIPWSDVVRHAKSIVDTRNALKGRRAKKIVRL